jgi:AcrR family transcriptional regulator
MSTAARREREFAAREELILGKARDILARDGFHGLHLDELAASVEYSKGTLYQHFASKEDLMLAVAARSMETRASLFARAAQFRGRPRERFRAFGVADALFVSRYPEHFQIEQTVKSASFWEKTSEERRKKHGLHLGACFRRMVEAVQEARLLGDLPESAPRNEEIVFSVIAVTIGSHLLSASPEVVLMVGIEDQLDLVRQGQEMLVDGFGWRPLSTEWDYRETERRVRQEVFAEAAWIK